MAVRPLRPATDRRLGEPLPHQLANRTRVPLQAPGPKIPSFDHHSSKSGMSCGISPPFGRLSPTRRQVTHALLTRLPLYSRPEGRFRVRLACMRHAASVDSEPGSNSQVESVRLGRPEGSRRTNIQHENRIGSCVVELVVRLILDVCPRRCPIQFSKNPAAGNARAVPPVGSPTVSTDRQSYRGPPGVSTAKRRRIEAAPGPPLRGLRLRSAPNAILQKSAAFYDADSRGAGPAT